MTTLTRDKLEEALQKVEQLRGTSDFMGSLYPYHYLRVFESNYLPKTHSVKDRVEVPRTTHERWLDPLLHP